MITVTANEFHEVVHSRNEDIVFNGPPSSLHGKIMLSNLSDDQLFVKDVPLMDDDAGLQNRVMSKSYGSAANSLPIQAMLMPGEERVHRVNIQLHPQTPPGVYESRISIGGTEKRIRMVVQEHIDMQIYPQSIDFLGIEPGKIYSKELLLANNGNVAITVPDNRHNTMLDFDYICRSFSKAIREKGGDGFQATMDELTRNIHHEMTDWVTVNIEEAGNSIEPGTSTPLHLSLTLPGNANPNRDYFGNIRLWNRTITYKMKSERNQTSR